MAMEMELWRVGLLEPGDRFIISRRQTPDSIYSDSGVVYVFEHIGQNGVAVASREDNRADIRSFLPTELVDVVYKKDLATLAEHEVVEDANIGATPTHTLTFPDGTLVSVYIDPDEGPTGAVVVLVDETRRAVRVTLSSNAEVRLWAVPAED